MVDEHLETSEPDIFAAGDVGQVLDPRTSKTTLDTLWNPARNQGHCAGLNMAGKTTAFCKPASLNVTRLAGLTTTIIGAVGSGGRDSDMIGIARGDSESWRETSGKQENKLISAQSDFDVNRLRLMMDETKLVGAFLMGDQTISNPVQQLVTHQANIEPIRGQLLHPNQPLSLVITNFYNQWQAQYAV